MVKGFILFCDLTPHLTKERRKVLERGADASLKHPMLLIQNKVSQREAKPLLIYPFPLHLIKGKGDKGGWGYQIQPKEGEVNKQSLRSILFLWESISVGNILQLSFGNMTHAATVYPALN